MAVRFLDGIDITGTSVFNSKVTFNGELNLGGTLNVVFLQSFITHKGDNDTHMGFPANDQWRVNIGGTTRLSVNSSGVVLNNVTNEGANGANIAIVDGSNIIKKSNQTLGLNAFNSTTIPTNAVLTSTNQSIAGIKTFTNDIVARTGGIDGGMKIGGWPQSPNGYGFIGTAGMTGLEYCMISDGTDTFLGAGTNGSLKLRGPANDSSPEIILNGALCEVNSGDLKVTDGSIAVGAINNSNTNGRIDASNDIVAFSSSDIRLKDNIKTIDNALNKVNNIQGIEFDWIEKEIIHGNKGRDVGVIAQEIEKILPEVVTTRDNGYKAVKYEKIVPLLIEAIKDLSKQVDGLKRLI